MHPHSITLTQMECDFINLYVNVMEFISRWTQINNKHISLGMEDSDIEYLY